MPPIRSYSYPPFPRKPLVNQQQQQQRAKCGQRQLRNLFACLLLTACCMMVTMFHIMLDSSHSTMGRVSEGSVEDMSMMDKQNYAVRKKRQARFRSPAGFDVQAQDEAKFLGAYDSRRQRSRRHSNTTKHRKNEGIQIKKKNSSTKYHTRNGAWSINSDVNFNRSNSTSRTYSKGTTKRTTRVSSHQPNRSSSQFQKDFKRKSAGNDQTNSRMKKILLNNKIFQSKANMTENVTLSNRDLISTISHVSNPGVVIRGALDGILQRGKLTSQHHPFNPYRSVPNEPDHIQFLKSPQDLLDGTFNIDALKPLPVKPRRTIQYLGVLLDAGRHYFPIDWIKRMINS